jgi:hypothetical protein
VSTRRTDVARRCGRSLALTLAALVLSGVLLTAPASAANPVRFATMDWPCDINRGYAYGEPVEGAHEHVLVRYSVAAGEASLDSNHVVAGEVVWARSPTAFSLTGLPSVNARCTNSTSFKATFFDEPTTPTTFRGAGGRSNLAFLTTVRRQYVADLTLSGGGGVAIYRRAASGVEKFTSSGQYQLGPISPGSHMLSVIALDGPTPTWSLTIHASRVPASSTTAPAQQHGLRARKLTPSVEKSVFDEVLMRRFSTIGYRACPSEQISGTHGLCVAELKAGAVHYIVFGTIRLSPQNRVFVATIHQDHWLRRWVDVPYGVVHEFKASGKAVANNPQFAWGFLIGAAHERFRNYQPQFIVDAHDGKSAGLLRFYIFRCHAGFRVVSCENALGDAIRYTP